MKVSIIIPVLAINDYIRESVPHLLSLDYTDFEVLILPNEVSEAEHQEFRDPRIRLIPTVKSAPAYKRDMGAKEATGEILAFLDDDAYPMSHWLKNAVKHFKYPAVGGVGGPAVTPVDDPWVAQVSGAVFTSFLGGGTYRYRYVPGKKVMSVDDYPSVNLLVRKDLFHEIGGFDSNYWPGEDTKLCLDIVNQGKKIIYDPAVFVYHHRRPSFAKHVKQVANYAKHRGHFVKKFPATSLRPSYFIPTFFVVYLLLFPIVATLPLIYKWLYFVFLIIYLFLLGISGIGELIRTKRISVGIAVIPLIFTTHLVYGIHFISGLVRKKI